MRRNRLFTYLASVIAASIFSSSNVGFAGEPAAQEEPAWLLLRIGAVRVATLRPGNAGAWDGAVAKGNSGAGCKLLALAAGAVSGGTAATATNLVCRFAGEGSGAQTQVDPMAPDLLIKIVIDAQTSYRTYIADDTYSHMFDYSLVVPVAAIPRGGLQIIAVDQDGADIGEGELIGSVRIPRAQLVAAALGPSPVITLEDGPLEKLELTVDPHAGARRAGAHEHPVTEPLTQVPLLRIHAGEVIELRARGSYSVTSNGDPLGPAGYQDGSRRSYNLPGPAFARMAHGAAVASVGHPGASANLAVADCVMLTSPFAGTLRVGINDHDRFNNKGALSLTAVVRPPRPEDWSRAGFLSACEEPQPVEARPRDPERVHRRRRAPRGARVRDHRLGGSKR